MDLREVLQTLGIETAEHGQSHHVSAGWQGFDCPSCSPRSGKFRLGVNLTSLRANCWVCGPVWLPEALSEASGYPLRDVQALLKGVPHANVPPPRKAGGRLRLPFGTEDLSPAHVAYLRSREPYPLDVDSLVRLWGLKGTGQYGDPPWHVVAPIMRDGRAVSWTARNIRPGGKRYDTAEPHEEAMRATECLYGWDYVRGAVIVHEGPGDVWRTGPGSVALMGVGWTPSQLRLLASVPLRVVCLDNTPEGHIKGRKLARELSLCGGQTLCVWTDSKDAGCATAEETQYLRSLIGG